MKKETIALVEWIKVQIDIAAKKDKSYLITDSAIDVHKKLEKEANEFLDHLPEIEEKLCFGGYIQDKNGTPCCHGDKVDIISQSFVGSLQWDSTNRRFNVVDDSGYEWVLSNWEFEKVEK